MMLEHAKFMESKVPQALFGMHLTRAAFYPACDFRYVLPKYQTVAWIKSRSIHASNHGQSHRTLKAGLKCYDLPLFIC